MTQTYIIEAFGAALPEVGRVRLDGGIYPPPFTLESTNWVLPDSKAIRRVCGPQRARTRLAAFADNQVELFN